MLTVSACPTPVSTRTAKRQIPHEQQTDIHQTDKEILINYKSHMQRYSRKEKWPLENRTSYFQQHKVWAEASFFTI